MTSAELQRQFYPPAPTFLTTTTTVERVVREGEVDTPPSLSPNTTPTPSRPGSTHGSGASTPRAIPYPQAPLGFPELRGAATPADDLSFLAHDDCALLQDGIERVGRRATTAFREARTVAQLRNAGASTRRQHGVASQALENLYAKRDGLAGYKAGVERLILENQRYMFAPNDDLANAALVAGNDGDRIVQRLEAAIAQTDSAILAIEDTLDGTSSQWQRGRGTRGSAPVIRFRDD
jgi:hypothetical protein